MKKLMTHMQTTRIGHNILIYCIILVSLLSCDLFRWDVDDDAYRFVSYIKNGTNDSLRIHLHKKNNSFEIDTTLASSHKFIYSGSPVSEEDDILTEHLFDDPYNDSYTLSVYKADTLVVKWDGPAKEMGDSIHHFYNYDSWDVELIGNDYELEFTIYESDIEFD